MSDLSSDIYKIILIDELRMVGLLQIIALDCIEIKHFKT